MKFQILYLMEFNQYDVAANTSLKLINMLKIKTSTVSDHLHLIE